MAVRSICRRWMHSLSAAVVMLSSLPLSAVSLAQAQPPGRTPPPGARGGGGGTIPTSASVMVTYRTRNVGDVHELELLVLWRGTPGWFAKGGQSGSSGTGGSRGTWSHRFSDGGYTFEISGDTDTRTAEVLGKTYDLTKGNAILIDGVDSPEGPRVVGTLALDSRLPNGSDPNQIFMLLGRSQELREYLRCDTSLPNPAMQARLASLCALVLSQ